VEPAAGTLSAVDPSPLFASQAEHDPTSRMGIEEIAGGVAVSFTLGGDGRRSQFAALAVPLGDDVPGFDALAFTGRAPTPMRLSVQLRYPNGQRWGRSVYLDDTPSGIVLPAGELLPLDGQDGAAPDPDTATSLLFVVDLVNAPPGAAGRFEITGLGLARRGVR
jgi:hypothetical protein